MAEMTSAAAPLKESLANEEDDYMSMTIDEPTAPVQKVTYTQRRIRKQRESEANSRTKSKAELALEEKKVREAALSTALPPSSKGFQMMAKLGFKPGSALGASTNSNARTEPLGIDVKEDRSGVGMENEKKRKFREEIAKAEVDEKKAKVEEGDFRARVAQEREERRAEGLSWAAMRVLEDLGEIGKDGDSKLRRPLKSVNLLYRGLVRERKEKERERRMRYDLHQSLGRDREYKDPEEDEQDRQALGKEEEDIEETDEELDQFMALETTERLGILVKYLREEHFYCFWCKHKYDHETLEGCPGLTEDDHD